MPEILTAEQVAERLQVKPSWVYYSAKLGRIRSRMVGRYRRFRWDEVLEDFDNGGLAV